MSPTQKETIKQVLTTKYKTLSKHLNEKTRRLWVVTEAVAIGSDGDKLFRGKRQMSIRASYSGMVDSQNKTLPVDRIRRHGGGRKCIVDIDNTIAADLDKLVDPVTRGDPESSLRWTSKSLIKLAEALTLVGHTISHTTVRKLLLNSGFSLQANRKTSEGSNHPDRDAQLHFINDTVKNFQTRNQPVISVDTKKKELIGNFKNNGKEWEKSKQLIEVNMHDFPDKELVPR